MMLIKLFFFTIILIFNFSNVAYSEQDEEPSTALGSIIGSATGALIGYQFGGGHGKYATTAAGAVAGYVLGGKVQENFNEKNEPFYQPEYGYQGGRPSYVGQDDYLIKQHLSNERKRRNMIRNGEKDPLEMPYDQSEVQTSWDDPNN
ncbi:MAG: glycine zipper 2TM domain-containing protein [Gammaproteobacteria bacterium]|nr:glycine zipper 2TM domain-containing protein [Gammaproteobacteria bacterium]